MTSFQGEKMEYSQVLEHALAIGKEKHPDAPGAHHGAFANSVAYAVTGWSGGYGGPSMREHWCSRLIHRVATPGAVSFEKAVKVCEEACYGPLTAEIASMLPNEHCFDDAHGEQEEASRLLTKNPR
jgi:hypothetical protein